MKNFKLFAVSLLSLFFSCTQSNNPINSPETINIDLESAQNEKGIVDFQSRFEIRLISLETTSESLVGEIRRLIVSGNNIFVTDDTQNAIFHFDNKGKFIKKIDRHGRGPQEYMGLMDIAVHDEKLYVFSMNDVKQYDFDGNFICGFPVDVSDQFTVDDSGQVIVASRYTQPYRLTVYSDSGEKMAQYFPSNLTDSKLIRCSEYSMGNYDGGVYVANYFDPTIYYLKNGEVKPMFILDFGKNNMPEEVLEGSSENRMDNFTKHRENSIMAINHITITDDWLIFWPEKSRDFYVVYYDRNQKSYNTNRGFNAPYSTFFGKYRAPKGYNSLTGEFYSTVSSFNMIDMMKELTDNAPDYKKTYPFLSKIDLSAINENDNPWLVFYNLK